jgi:hypothetical protein
MSKFTAEQIQQLNENLKTPQEVLKWSKWTFQAKTTLLAEFAKA